MRATSTHRTSPTQHGRLRHWASQMHSCSQRWQGKQSNAGARRDAQRNHLQRLGLLQEMVHKLLTTDVVSFNAGISACEKGKQ